MQYDPDDFEQLTLVEWLDLLAEMDGMRYRPTVEVPVGDWL